MNLRSLFPIIKWFFSPRKKLRAIAKKRVRRAPRIGFFEPLEGRALMATGIANDDFLEIGHDRTLNFTINTAPSLVLSANDGDGHKLRALSLSSVTSLPTNGSLTRVGPYGGITYTPYPAFVGKDYFSYYIEDVAGHSGTALVEIDVTNSAPTGITLSNNSVYEGRAAGTTVGTLGAIDYDARESFSFSLVPGAADNNLFQIEGRILKTAAIFNYESRNSYSVTIQANDIAGQFVTETLTVNVKNIAPTAKTGTKSGAVAPAQITGVLSGTDPEGAPLTFGIAGNPNSNSANGSVFVNSDGTFTYIPNAGFRGTDSFEFTVNDGELSGTARYFVVVGSNLPTVSVKPKSTIIGQNGAVKSGVVEGDTMVFDLTVTLPAGVVALASDVQIVWLSRETGTAKFGGAGEPSDFESKADVVTFPANSQGAALTTTITVGTNSDSDAEPDESFFVNITNVTNARIGTGSAQGTIRNNDIRVTLLVPESPQSIVVNEGNDPFNGGYKILYKVEGAASAFANGFAAYLLVNTSEDGSADADEDYKKLENEEISLVADGTNLGFWITIYGDTDPEPTEFFDVLFSVDDVWTTATVTFGKGVTQASIGIKNDD